MDIDVRSFREGLKFAAAVFAGTVNIRLSKKTQKAVLQAVRARIRDLEDDGVLPLEDLNPKGLRRALSDLVAGRETDFDGRTVSLSVLNYFLAVLEGVRNVRT